VRRRLFVAAATMGIAATLGAAPAEAVEMHSSASMGAGIAAEINRARAERGLGRLRQVTPLRRAAQQHVYEMAVLGFFSHASRSWPSLGARLAAFYPWRGYGTWIVGETLLWGQLPLPAGSVVQMWLNSPEHRRELLDPRFRDIGVDAVELSGAGGVFSGRRVLLVAAEFGARY
jgi:uncharacterized protein YkwD